jgi:hypothetical protein
VETDSLLHRQNPSDCFLTELQIGQGEKRCSRAVV